MSRISGGAVLLQAVTGLLAVAGLAGLGGCGSIDQQSGIRVAVGATRQRNLGAAQREGSIPAEAEEVRYSDGRGLFLRIDPQSHSGKEREVYAVITGGHWTPTGILIPADRILPLCGGATIPKAACEYYHSNIYGSEYLNKPEVGSPSHGETQANLEAEFKYQCLEGPPVSPSQRALYGPGPRPPEESSVCELVKKASKRGRIVNGPGR